MRIRVGSKAEVARSRARDVEIIPIRRLPPRQPSASAPMPSPIGHATSSTSHRRTIFRLRCWQRRAHARRPQTVALKTLLTAGTSSWSNSAPQLVNHHRACARRRRGPMRSRHALFEPAKVRFAPNSGHSFRVALASRQPTLGLRSSTGHAYCPRPLGFVMSAAAQISDKHAG